MWRHGITLFTAICAFIVTLLVIQLWLLSAALDAFLGAEPSVLWPAAIASALLAAMNAGLLIYVLSFDRRFRNAASERPHA